MIWTRDCERQRAALIAKLKNTQKYRDGTKLIRDLLRSTLAK